MKAFPKSDKLRAFIAPKMTDLITFLENNVKSAVYIGGDIHGIYRYLEMVGAPTKFSTSGQRYHHFSIHEVQKNTICKYCGRVGHKDDVWIICGPNFLPPILIIKINQLNTLHGNEPTEKPIDLKNQPPSDHLEPRTSPPKTNPVVSDIMGILNHQTIDNGYVEVQTSEFSVESNYESVLDSDITPIK